MFAIFNHRHMTIVIFMSITKHNTISAADFKATCLKLMDYVNQTHQTIIITKHNKPIAKLAPIIETPQDIFGCMKNTVTIKLDIIAPIDISWNADNE